MALGGVIGNGTKVGFSASSPVTWTRLGQIRNIPDFIALIADDVDTTVYNENSNIMTATPGMIPPPEVTLELVADLDPATSAAHETLRLYGTGSGDTVKAGATIWWRIEVPVNRQKTSFRAIEFEAYVKGITIAVPITDLVTTTATLKFDGDGVAFYNPAASQIT